MSQTRTKEDDPFKVALKAAKGVSVHNGSLRLQFKLPGQLGHTRKSLGYPPTLNNIDVAINRLRNIKKDIENGLFKYDEEEFWSKHFPTSTRNVGSSITVEACFKSYVEENDSVLSDSIRDKLNTALNWLSHYRLASKPLGHLTKTVLKDLRKKSVLGNRKTKFAGCTVTTVNEYSSTLRRVLDYAVEEEHLKENPMRLVPPLKKDDLNLEYYDRYVKPFTVNELDCLLATIHVPSVKQMVKFLAWTGLRHGELKALAWEDVDLENKKIIVKYNLTRKGKLKPPKTKSGYRVVELLPAALAVLEEMKDESAALPPVTDKIHYKYGKFDIVERRRVFLGRANQPYKRPELTTAPKQWEKWLREAGVSYRAAYQLRHTYASRMLTAGCNEAWLASQMGHANTNMIATIYGKWIPEDNPNYIAQLAKKLGQNY